MREERSLTQSSFARGLSVLAAVAEGGESRVDDLAQDLGIPLSTVYRYLRTLRELHLIEDRDGVYVPGWRLLELSGHHFTQTRLVEVGHAVLDDVVEAIGETAVLTVRYGTRAMCLRQVQSPHPLRYAFRINQLLALHAGAGQRVLLAHAPAAVVEKVLEQPMRKFTANTPSREQVARGLAAIRREGVAVSRGELAEGALAIAMPVCAGGEVICSVTIAGPESRCDATWRRNARKTLADATRHLADLLDHRTPGAR